MTERNSPPTKLKLRRTDSPPYLEFYRGEESRIWHGAAAVLMGVLMAFSITAAPDPSFPLAAAAAGAAAAWETNNFLTWRVMYPSAGGGDE